MVNGLEIKDYFFFTQVSLTTFENCPLKFKKRYLENIKWDMGYEDGAKSKIDLGNSFHLIAARYFSGVDTGLDSSMENFDILNKWYLNLKEFFVLDNKLRYLPEYKLRLGENKLRLEANYDLIIVNDSSLEIWDFKTGDIDPEFKDKAVSKLRNSLQTVIYMFVLKELSGLILTTEIDFEEIKMHYWHPENKEVILQIDYSKGTHMLYKELLENKVRDILDYDFMSFDKNRFTKHCKYCEFNWLCNNKKVNTDLIYGSDDFLDEISLENIDELI